VVWRRRRRTKKCVEAGKLPIAEGPSLDEEMPFIAEVIKGGRLTIPEEIRKLLLIKEGNYVLVKLKVISRKRLGPRRSHNNQRNSLRNGNIWKRKVRRGE
jgi:bifunctional DNA-binding transcriptional regulator/antitoxin component of YhaV-PrlF toxin-antitoxin module